VQACVEHLSREFAADLAVQGSSFSKIAMIDMCVNSPLSHSHVTQMLAHVKPTLADGNAIIQFLQSRENDKRTKYAGKLRTALNTGGATSLASSISNLDPLQLLNLDFIPTAATPLGNIGPALDGFIKQLSCQAVTQHEEALGYQLPPVANKILRTTIRNRYRQLVAVAIAKTLAYSFDPNPSSVSARIAGQRLHTRHSSVTDNTLIVTTAVGWPRLTSPHLSDIAVAPSE
jgi:hypothetical protein